MSGVVVGLLGVLLSDQVGNGLLTAKRNAALSEVDAGLGTAQGALTSASLPNSDAVDRTLEQVTTDLYGRGSAAGLFDIAVLPTEDDARAYAAGELRPQEIPVSLRKAVVAGDVLAYQYVWLPRQGRLQPELVVGAPLFAPYGDYELYYVFPLDDEFATLALVRRLLEYGGLALVVLLALVAWLVSRQVVRPVRIAARVASRLAAGRLEERMPVRGEDDLARLAATFNEMARALQRHITQLEDLSRVQRRFTADVSHELRTPLTTVRMAADLIHESRANFEPAVARSAELLQGELNRFETMLTDLLEISRYDARAAVLDVEPVDLTALVRDEVAACLPLAAQHGVSLVLDDVPAEPVLLDADPRRLRRVVRNLLGNAIEHGQRRPVEIAVAADADVVALRIRDHGVGLRPGDERRVFERFWRADPSRTRRVGGTGLGLSISLEDARLHGGTLEAWGREGRGAAFRLALPRVAGGRLRGAVPLALADTLPAELPSQLPAELISGVADDAPAPDPGVRGPGVRAVAPPPAPGTRPVPAGVLPAAVPPSGAPVDPVAVPTSRGAS